MTDYRPSASDAFDQHQHRIRASDRDRDDVLQVISNAHVAGRLSPEDLDERQNAILACIYLHELLPIIHDIPEGREIESRIREETNAPKPGGTSSAVQPKNAVVPARPGDGPTVTDIAVLGGSSKSIAANTPQVTSFALMGGSDLYLSEVCGPGAEITIFSMNTMGGSDIYVPAGVRIIDHSVNILGGNDIKPNAFGDGSNGTLIIKGFNLMGGNDVHLDPGVQTGGR
ncbi:DUF1707 domain-containing protein [Brevibacterium sp. Marseille-P9724]|uniref:DUF1707 SHOCT-like domain-containing protein n=1 Tax=Brevibacterium sp. Marseille-P9724 TaxID=2614125 RepID=UPI00125F1222|nr:DUF1707 domain-containing protein [Brevibacterium sp. Marseille-P9724]